MFEMMAQNDGSGVIVFLFMLFLMLLFFTAAIASMVFWILMIIDCAKRKNLSDGERVAWILVLVFLGVIGATVYYFAVKRK